MAILLNGRKGKEEIGERNLKDQKDLKDQENLEPKEIEKDLKEIEPKGLKGLEEDVDVDVN